MELVQSKEQASIDPRALNVLLNAKAPVLMFANGYGDHYLNLPAFRAFAEIYAGRLTLVGIEGAIKQVSVGIDLRRLVELPMKHSATGRLFDVGKAHSAIGDCDVFISLNPWMNDDLSLLLLKLQPEYSMGFFKEYDLRVPRDYGKHTVDLSFDLVKLLQPSWEPSMYAQPPSFPIQDIDSAERIWEIFPANGQVMCLHLDTLPDKMWSEEAWLAFIDRFLDEYPNFSVLIVGMNGIESSSLRNTQRIIPAYRLSIPVSGLLLSKCDIFVGVDSVFLHIADLFAVPAIGLFGPTNPSEWGVRFGPGASVSKISMSDIQVEQVFDEVIHLLGNKPDRSAD